MNKIDWSIPQRQAPVGLILFSINIFQKLIKRIWPILILVIFKDTKEGDKDLLYFWISIVAVIFILGNALLSYWFYKFQIVDNEFVVNKGYLKKIRLSIPLERIQTINIKQNILQKWLNVVSLQIDTAGAQTTEIKLIAIKKEIAQDLKLFFQNKTSNNNEDNLKNTQENFVQKILNLKSRDLIKVALSENHFRSFFIILSLTYGLFYQIKNVFEEETEQIAKESYQVLESMNYTLYFSLFIFVLSLSVSFIIVFLRFYNLQLSKIKEAFIIRFGLFNVKEINVPMQKIQFISWHQNPLRTLLNYQTLKIKQASSSNNTNKEHLIEIPACSLKQEKEIEAAIFEETASIFSLAYKSHWIYFLKNFLIISLLIILLSFIFYQDSIYYKISVFSIFLLIALYQFLSFRQRQFRISENILEITKGQISKTIYRLQNYKIQSITFKQSILAKRRKLASLVLYTAAGKNLSIPYISEELAKKLYQFLLYKIESTHKTWM